MFLVNLALGPSWLPREASLVDAIEVVVDNLKAQKAREAKNIRLRLGLK